jgi:hypothetical protein
LSISGAVTIVTARMPSPFGRLCTFPLPSRGAMLLLYVAAGLIAGSLSLALGQSLNLDVYRGAAHALLHGDDLYVLHARDYFKYSPTFALLFVPLAYLRPAIAAPLWSAANFLFAFYGIDRSISDPRRRRVALTVALGGILLTTDGDQSNLLVVGALLLAVHAFENDRRWAGACLLALGTHVKIFPAVGAVVALLRPRPLRTLGAITAMTLLAAALPVLSGVCAPRALAAQYASWWRLLEWDHPNRGWSAMNMLQAALGVSWPNAVLQMGGIALESIPIGLGLRFPTDPSWRRLLTCSLLAFSVLFNHRAEYATFVVTGVALALWIATMPPAPIAVVLAIAALVAPGPFFARPDPAVGGIWTFLAAHRLFHPLRVVPLFAVWLFMLWRLVGRFVTVRVSVRFAPTTHAS